jgi:inorganic pyrophosphatase/exopolyphosphatase
MKIITAGSLYLDIDAYAGIIAYAELLNKQGIEARAVSTAALNESIPASVRAWPVLFDTTYKPSVNDAFTLIDISTPDYFDSIVDHDRIDAVIDHHPGYEEYWQERIGGGTNIEPIGAACTQVYEYWKKAGLVDQMGAISAGLLMCGILDNTLNFGAKISTERDEAAYHDLARLAGLPADWPARYFGEIQQSIVSDPVVAIQKDTKTVGEFPSQDQSVLVGQFAVWHATDILDTHRDNLAKAFNDSGAHWFINIISIGERKSYLLCDDPDTQQWLSALLDVQFDGNLAVADRLWLRKEIIKQDIMLTIR